ncbi:MAG: DNA polymerase III subunit delta [Candidatus Yanofskybacteria bacterium RIFCSPHIGHO2_01_FULL_41_21]|uniref:DNA-directed DNA polymerase n=1 Tax=Candidatus Yanofskybacteria bacterium RIFCSPHIGHO2_01_FULL_41_21 TaxID=1802660 RepID=A0A1F8EB63_9BACT|nr:MAG: DNA polymerase III subunit delta [Candidatus Yanofskybacteria bacterium RIFCSPHIGHO2_01_FULL_41_21]
MIIFLYGDDTFRLYENRESVIKSYKAKHGSGFNFFRIDACPNDWSPSVGRGALPSVIAQVTEAIKSVSLFDEVKLILINNIFSNLQTAKDLHELFTKHKIATSKEIVILATHSGTVTQARPKELLAFLSDSKNLIRNFTNLEGAQLQAWIKKEVATLGVSFASGALARFIAIGGMDSWARIHNLNKLANYSKNTISIADIDLLIKTETEPNVFEFIDALGSGRKAQAFSLLCGELAHGRDPYYLLSMVMYQFRNMLMVKDFADRNISSAQIAQKAGIHPFVVKKMLSATARLSLIDIKRLYQEILDLEQGTKQGKRDLEDGLFMLALS